MSQIVVAEYLSLDGIGEDPGRIGEFERRGWMMLTYRRPRDEGDRPASSDEISGDWWLHRRSPVD